MNRKAPENCLFSPSNGIISEISVESRAWNPFYFRLAFQLTDFNALNYAQTMPSFHVLSRGKKKSRFFSIYLWFWNWKIHTNTMEKIIIISNWTDCSDDSRRRIDWDFFFLKNSKRKMFPHVVGEKSEDEMLYLCDDDERKRNFFSLSENFPYGRIIYGFDDNIPRLIAKAFLAHDKREVKLTRLFSSASTEIALESVSFSFPFVFPLSTWRVQSEKRKKVSWWVGVRSRYIVIARKVFVQFSFFPSPLFSSLSSRIVSWRDFGNFPHEWRFDYSMVIWLLATWFGLVS